MSAAAAAAVRLNSKWQLERRVEEDKVSTSSCTGRSSRSYLSWLAFSERETKVARVVRCTRRAAPQPILDGLAQKQPGRRPKMRKQLTVARLRASKQVRAVRRDNLMRLFASPNGENSSHLGNVLLVSAAAAAVSRPDRTEAREAFRKFALLEENKSGKSSLD